MTYFGTRLKLDPCKILEPSAHVVCAVQWWRSFFHMFIMQSLYFSFCFDEIKTLILYDNKVSNCTCLWRHIWLKACLCRLSGDVSSAQHGLQTHKCATESKVTLWQSANPWWRSCWCYWSRDVVWSLRSRSALMCKWAQLQIYWFLNTFIQRGCPFFLAASSLLRCYKIGVVFQWNLVILDNLLSSPPNISQRLSVIVILVTSSQDGFGITMLGLAFCNISFALHYIRCLSLAPCVRFFLMT